MGNEVASRGGEHHQYCAGQRPFHAPGAVLAARNGNLPDYALLLQSEILRPICSTTVHEFLVMCPGIMDLLFHLDKVDGRCKKPKQNVSSRYVGGVILGNMGFQSHRAGGQH